MASMTEMDMEVMDIPDGKDENPKILLGRITPLGYLFLSKAEEQVFFCNF